ncbi:hypothetical protein VaNZ11_014643 [Volvox africanus]|uniref:Protein kinase domain-containing protein n=1 Tax=Volvox africanus TaxID=51714 RepID=A0ABQ5SIX2_9CHLO|nr:hypothetical protein VaNZ11_014643 [Volvox africanus]
MLFCCFRTTNTAEGSHDGVPAKFSELQREGVAVQNGATEPIATLQGHVQTCQAVESEVCEQQQPTACESSPQAKCQQVTQDAVMRVVAILQELLGLTCERMQVSRIMALLCQRLCVSWACLTALSVDGKVFQHIGSAYAVEPKISTCSFSSCRTSSGIPTSSGAGRGPPSRTSSMNSIVGSSAVEVGMSDPHLLEGSETSIEAAATSNQPLMLSDPGPAPGQGHVTSVNASPSAALSNGQQQPPMHPFWSSSGAGADVPQTHPKPRPQSLHSQSHLQQQQQQQQLQSHDDRGEVPVSSWPIDWQLMNRERGMRAFACLPVSATNGSGTIIGCLSLGSMEPLDWSRQFWAGSSRLITGWAASAITTTRATARATFYSRLFCAMNLDGLARAFAYDMPVFLADGAAGPGTALPEVRLALVSSRLQHAVVYAAPLLQVSGRLGLRPMIQAGLVAGGGAGGVHGNGTGGAGPLIAFGGFSGPSGSGASMAGLVLGSANSLGTERGLILGGGLGITPTTHPAAAAVTRGGGGTTSGYENLDCMVLGTTMDVDDQLSGYSSSNSAGGNGGVPSARRGNTYSAAGNGGEGGKGSALSGCNHGGPPVQEAPPVDCVKISTDSTLLMSVLEAGDIMIIKDALHYFGGGRMVARDLALNNTRPATAGTLVILPLVHRCRALGCVYVFARNEFNLTFSRAAWGDMAAMLSRAVFGQLVGKLRHEWYAVLSEDPESHVAQFRNGRSKIGVGSMGVSGSGRSRVRRTTTGNSLCSNASSLRPSFELPGRSVEQAAGQGGGNKEAAAALAAAAAALEYAGFMLPDGDDGPMTAAATAPTSRSPGATTVSSSPRHRIPSEHAAIGSTGGGSGGSAGSSETPIMATVATTVAAAPAATAAPKATVGSDPPSTSPGSLSFRLPPEVQDQGQDATRGAEVAEAGQLGADPSRPDSQVSLCGPDSEQGRRGTAAAAAGTRGPTAGGALGPLTQGQPESPSALQAKSFGGRGMVGAVPAAGESMNGITEVVDEDGEEAEEISGSSRELQGWPELVDILYDMHRTRNVSVYLAAYRGQAVAIKMMRAHMSMDGRPGHLETEALTIAAQQQLSTIRHPNVLHVLMVYPVVYEVVSGKAQRGTAHSGGPTSGAAANAATGPHSHGQQQHQLQQPQQQQQHLQPQQQQQQQQQLQQQYALGRGPFNMMAHAMSDLLSGAGASEVSGVGVYLTAVLPRREKFKQGLALMLELFPSLSLREALQKRMLLWQPDLTGGGGLAFGEQLGAAASYTYVNSQIAMLSDAGHPSTPTAGQISSGPVGGHVPPYLPSLPEVASGNDPVFNVDSCPGLAITGASNSCGANTATFGSGPATAHVGQTVPPVPLLLAILSQIAAGMAALHSAGLAHGELRPENVLLALPHGGSSHTNSAQHERTGVVECSNVTPRASPTPPPPTPSVGAGVVLCAGGGGPSTPGMGVSSGSRGRSGGGWISGSSSCGCSGDPERVLRPERPMPGRPITTDVMVKIKDAGMTIVSCSKGTQAVRKLLQRNRSAILPYMPPEVHRGERFGRSADVYMFGILMWELYTGGVAFSNLTGTPIKLLQTIIADGVRPLWPEGTPVWYQSLATRCWAGNPKQRPSFRRIGDKLAEASSVAMANAGWGPGGGGAALQGVAVGMTRES